MCCWKNPLVFRSVERCGDNRRRYRSRHAEANECSATGNILAQPRLTNGDYSVADHAATGGDALEALNATTIGLSSCLLVQPYIVTDPMTAALSASASVNIYSVDLAEVPSVAGRSSRGSSATRSYATGAG